MRYTRRATIAAGTGLATLAIAHRAASLAATPEASPIVDHGFVRPEMLADVAWLKEHLGDPTVVLVGFTPADEFAEGHIAGSRQIDWPELEVTDTSDESLAAWQEVTEGLLSGLGITPGSTVITWDTGTLFAARMWWVLSYLGHRDVRVLNGGLAAWTGAGNDLETGSGNTELPHTEPYRGTLQPDLIAQFAEVVPLVGDPGVVFVDARTADEYAEGHIPGAVNVNYPLNAMTESPKAWKPASELCALYAEAGVTPDLQVIPYCSTGVRSAVAAFTLRLIGYDNVPLFTGSWKEWSSHPDTPKTTGDQP